MSREIKVKAWHKLLKEFVPVHRSCVISSDGQLSPIDNVELIQFTGLHDVNGVEIYEGDIVLISKDERYVLDTEKTMQVVFKRGAFYGKSSPHSVGTLISSNLLRTKVIGNIYQNPELLEQK